MSQDDRIAAIEAENRQLRQALDVAGAQNALACRNSKHGCLGRVCSPVHGEVG